MRHELLLTWEATPLCVASTWHAVSSDLDNLSDVDSLRENWQRAMPFDEFVSRDDKYSPTFAD